MNNTGLNKWTSLVNVIIVFLLFWGSNSFGALNPDHETDTKQTTDKVQYTLKLTKDSSYDIRIITDSNIYSQEKNVRGG